MGQVELAGVARSHALRAIAVVWAVLAMVLGVSLAMSWPWVDAVLPVDGAAIVPFSMLLAAALVAALPVDRLGDRIVADLLGSQASGRLRNVAEEVSIAIGEPAGRVMVHDAEIPNVGAFPTRSGVVVMATAGAVEQLDRDELESLVAAQLAGMRDPWCRLATRAELAWTGTIALSFMSWVIAPPAVLFIGVVMMIVPRTIEAARDLCADVAAVAATRNPAALAGSMRHLAAVSGSTSRQRLATTWYLPLNPFLALPKRVRSTTTISTMGGESRRFDEADEVESELLLRADRAEALAAGGDPRRFTGREFRRRWHHLGRTTEADGPEP